MRSREATGNPRTFPLTVGCLHPSYFSRPQILACLMGNPPVNRHRDEIFNVSSQVSRVFLCRFTLVFSKFSISQFSIVSQGLIPMVGLVILVLLTPPDSPFSGGQNLHPMSWSETITFKNHIPIMVRTMVNPTYKNHFAVLKTHVHIYICGRDLWGLFRSSSHKRTQTSFYMHIYYIHK